MKPMLLACIAISTIVAAPVAAQTIVPISAFGSSSVLGYDVANTIDQGPGAATTDWAMEFFDTDRVLNLDLGSVVTLTRVSLVDRVTSGGPNGAFAGGTGDFTTQFSIQGFTDSTYTVANGAALIFNKATPMSPTTFNDFAFTGVLANFQATQFVRYAVLASNGMNAGLSDISFSTAVPEPASWAMLIAGFGLVGAVARRRQRMAVVA